MKRLKKVDTCIDTEVQILKVITRATKLVKAFLVQKLVRKLKDLSNSTEQDALAQKMDRLKGVNHNEMAKSIFMKTFKGTEAAISHAEEDLISKFISNSKMQKVLQDCKDK